jgi:hypothetical protein
MKSRETKEDAEGEGGYPRGAFFWRVLANEQMLSALLIK